MEKEAIPTMTFPISALSLLIIPVALEVWTAPIDSAHSKRKPMVPVMTVEGMLMVKMFAATLSFGAAERNWGGARFFSSSTAMYKIK